MRIGTVSWNLGPMVAAPLTTLIDREIDGVARPERIGDPRHEDELVELVLGQRSARPHDLLHALGEAALKIGVAPRIGPLGRGELPAWLRHRACTDDTLRDRHLDPRCRRAVAAMRDPDDAAIAAVGRALRHAEARMGKSPLDGQKREGGRAERAATELCEHWKVLV